jgi:hypothetical protein
MDLFRNLFHLAIVDAVFVIPSYAEASSGAAGGRRSFVIIHPARPDLSLPTFLIVRNR